uniref:Ycf1 n=1 Tax=Hattoria yakushimensis TaxID=2136784 RepID=A0A8F3BE19_9MARC|nr:Ycf1 [Hattoria yakushimensis]
MILPSQAYVLRRIWGMKTNNKSYLKCLSKSWTFDLFIKNNFKIFLQEHGIISYLEFLNFREKNWKKWINYFNRYNLSPKVWYSIAPQKWRFKVTEHWKKNKVFGIREKENLLISEKLDESSIFCINPLIEGAKKSNKLFTNNLFTSKFFDSNQDPLTKRSLQFGEKSNNNNNNIITNKIHKDFFIKNKERNFPHCLANEKNIFFEYNLLLWFAPEFVEQKDRDKYKKIWDLDTSVTKYKNLEIFRNKELLRERELNQSIRQWRWESRNYEKRFRKLGNLASLMTFMQNQETTVSLSGKMRKDLDLFRLFFRRNNNFNRLAINSEHRLPRLLDDQFLIYKLISPSLNFKQRVKKLSNFGNIDEYSLNINQKKILVSRNSLNLEDILLSKRRREFRILNSLTLQRNKNGEFNENFLKKIQGQNPIVEKNINEIIKRFIWSSYRFEDLVCMNRFRFNTMNGSRFSMLRFRMYPIV